MSINSHEYHSIEAAFNLQIEQIRSLISLQDVEAVEHYLKHAEIEMAFESLGLSLMQHRVRPTTEVAQILLQLGLRLNLDKESVFDNEFWSKFSCFLGGRT